MGQYIFPLRFIVVGIAITVMGAWSLLVIDGKDHADVRRMGWPFIIVGPAVTILGVVLWPRPNRQPGKTSERSPDGPYTAADFPGAVQPTAPPGHFREIVTTSGEEPSDLVVYFSIEEYAPIALPEVSHPGARSLSAELDLAFRASPGAERDKPNQVGLENWTGMWEDARVWYEGRVTPTPANVAALRAVKIAWDDNARRLASQFAFEGEAIEQIREAMRRLALQDLRDTQRRIDQARALAGAESATSGSWR